MRDIVVLPSAKVESERNRRSSQFAHSVERVDNILEVSVSCFGCAYSAFCMDPYVVSLRHIRSHSSVHDRLQMCQTSCSHKQCLTFLWSRRSRMFGIMMLLSGMERDVF